MMFLGECARDHIESLVGRARQDAATGVETFSAVDGQDALVIIDSESDIDHASLVPVRQLFAGGCLGASGGNYLFRVGIWLPAASRAEFLDWYESEHLPILLECPTWGGCRFVEKQVRDGHQFYALHQLEVPSALQSDERRRSRATAWFMRLKQHSWFDEAFTRQLYVRMEA